ncbi:MULTISPECIES: hypothetical protein [Streptomyces]|uniref:hypothetical protein n=1 Tax=Streptomyces TaxID=1883 RepID=UPI00278C394A|nr:hypothetical protein [Streptomyces hydrogenans]
MAEIDMPGDEVERLGGLLRRVVELIDTKPSGFTTEDVGPPLARSGGNFDDEWKDGRAQVKRNTKDLTDACEAIVKAFDDFDRQMGDSLKGDGDGGRPGR